MILQVRTDARDMIDHALNVGLKVESFSNLVHVTDDPAGQAAALWLPNHSRTSVRWLN